MKKDLFPGFILIPVHLIDYSTVKLPLTFELSFSSAHSFLQSLRNNFIIIMKRFVVLFAVVFISFIAAESVEEVASAGSELPSSSSLPDSLSSLTARPRPPFRRRCRRCFRRCLGHRGFGAKSSPEVANDDPEASPEVIDDVEDMDVSEEVVEDAEMEAESRVRFPRFCRRCIKRCLPLICRRKPSPYGRKPFGYRNEMW